VQTLKRLLALGFAALAVAGCSNDESSAPSTAPVSAATSVADTTVVSTTSPTSSTSSTTIVATTLPATTTTVATEDLIKKAVQDYFAAYILCGQAPASCDPSTFTATKGPSREKISELIKGMSQEGLHFSADLRGTRLVAESVATTELATTAIYCAYDALTVLGPLGPDGQPTVVNDVISNVRYVYNLFFESGIWLVGQQTQLEHLPAGNLCPAA